MAEKMATACLLAAVFTIALFVPRNIYVILSSISKTSSIIDCVQCAVSKMAVKMFATMVDAITH